MYYYGLFICDENLHPVSRTDTYKIMRLMAEEYRDTGWPCTAYVLGAGGLLVDQATEFGAPVNAVLVSEQYATERGLRNNMVVRDDVVVFVLAYYGNEDPLWRPELGRRLLDTDCLPVYLADAIPATYEEVHT